MDNPSSNSKNNTYLIIYLIIILILIYVINYISHYTCNSILPVNSEKKENFGGNMRTRDISIDGDLDFNAVQSKKLLLFVNNISMTFSLFCAQSKIVANSV
jgi:hypothetical protein